VADPDYYSIVRRETVEALAKGSDEIAALAQEMIASTDEEAVFIKRVKVYFQSADRDKRRYAITALASTFGAPRDKFKKYLLFKGLVNRMD